MSMCRLLLVSSSFILICALEAGATDGVIEINQAKALAGAINGSLVSDPAGFPVAISARGSYRLTSDLVVPDANTTAILLQASDVSLDLNGFGIHGPTLCEGQQSCTGSGTGLGVGFDFATGGNRVSVKNGFVEGMGSHGLFLGSQAHIERLMVRNNGGHGILVGPGGIVLANRVQSNGAIGMLLGTDTIYEDNVILTNLSGASVIGGVATGGNRCDDRRCSSNPARRRFYLTTGGFDAAAAPVACMFNFHMATLHEIVDPSSLVYETMLGQTKTDGPFSPPAGEYGWVRTGDVSSIVPVEGIANCDSYTSSSPSGRGTMASLDGYWDAAPTKVSPWRSGLAYCNVPLPVWCVED